MSLAHSPQPGRLSNQDFIGLVAGRLRDRLLGLEKAVAPLLEARDAALAQHGSGELRAAAAQYDDLLVRILAHRYDALDKAVRDNGLPFAEIDHAGRICYANPAFSAHVADPIGQPFAGLFGSREAEVAAGLEAGTNISFRLELHVGELPRQFRVELGPLADEAGKPGAYAILLDVSAEEERLNAAKHGILRVDRRGMVVFANNAAAAMLGSDRASLLGTRAGRLFRDPADPSADYVTGWIGLDASQDRDLFLAHSETPVRVTALPFYDEPGRNSGLLLTFRSMVGERARRQLQRLLLEPGQTPEELVCGIMEAVRSVVPSDMMTFGIYTGDMGHFRTLVVDPELRSPWSTRWFKLNPGVEAWLNEGKTYESDLQNFVDETMPEAARNPVVLAMREQKLKGFLSLPVRGTGGRFRSALTLISKRHGAYGQPDLDRLRRLGLEEVLQAVEDAFSRRRDACVRKLKQELSSAQSAKALARHLAEGVSRCFGWEYAGVFRVDRSSGEFVLFAQFPATGDKLIVKDGYRQPLAKGMLGHAFRRAETLIDPDVQDSKWDFVSTADGQASAMVVPITVNGRVELLLDLESVQTNAFQGDDMQIAEDLAADCQQIFGSRWNEAIRTALLNTMEQAAVVVDATGLIRQMNPAAEEMLGPAVAAVLSDLGADEASRQALGTGAPCDQRHLVLRRSGEGADIPTLGTQRPLNDDYGHRMWLFSNLKEQRWARDWRYLDQTVTEVARQTRAPLLIADGLLRRIKDLMDSAGLPQGLAGLLERAASQLGKADLTFERLADTLTAHQKPSEAKATFDALGTLMQSVQALPEDDAASVAVECGLDEFPVQGWEDRLGFAFRSLLAHLLQDLEDEGRVQVTGSAAEDGGLQLRFRPSSLAEPPPAPDPADPIATAADRARRLVQLAPGAVSAAITWHGGRFVHDPSGPEFRITLPPAPVTAAPAAPPEATLAVYPGTPSDAPTEAEVPR